MTLKNLHKTPWPYFGGKADAAEIVWRALGDVAHYVEPFAGSLAVLLRRPHQANRTYYSETVNDIDGFLVNAWRSIQWHPDDTAEAASWPVSEVDIMARHLHLVRWMDDAMVEKLRGDHAFCDPKIAGYWIWGICGWIGSGWCSGKGPWVADADGRIYRRDKDGRSGASVEARRPHMGNDGRGVNRPQAREPGVAMQRPHVTNGRGVNRPQAREPGVKMLRPHVGNNGQGVNHAGAREPGVKMLRPHMGDDGRGVNRPQAREPGVSHTPEAAEWCAAVAADYQATEGYHPMTMPELRRWFHFLSARLRHVRIICGDWQRMTTSAVVKTLSCRMGGDGVAGIFLDPPYGDVRSDGLYAQDSLTVAKDVNAWCARQAVDPHVRIVLAGFECEHDNLEQLGWTKHEWFKAGFLKGGMAQAQGKKGGNQHRERIWCSPTCLKIDQEPEPVVDRQGSLFGDSEAN